MKITKVNMQQYGNDLRSILDEISKQKEWDNDSLSVILRRFPKGKNKTFAKDELVYAYNIFKKKNGVDRKIEERIRMKPTRTDSGVAVVTVLTKPFPCPGQCIYCPNEANMPKSYIASEPGAQRALKNDFDPYAQTYNRLIALKSIGHNVEKVELIILGGTWSVYPKEYQMFFIYECFRALNNMKKENFEYVTPRKNAFTKISWNDLDKQQKINEIAYCRNVGLVLETRPDYITTEEIINMRKLGATKVQLGIQSMSNKILKMNQIGRDKTDAIRAFEIGRLAGFKIHAHWMPNLYGSTPKRDISDYKRLWKKDLQPDELKIYPTSVIENTKLNTLYEKGLHKPYSNEELIYVFKNILPLTPRYCRLTRIIRDIPSNEIVAGNKVTNLRQILEEELGKENIIIQDIRKREIKGKKIHFDNLELERIGYDTTVSKEIFLSYKTKDTDQICGFLRLSLPHKKHVRNHFIDELKGCSMIREVHVYGKVVGLKNRGKGESQHIGLGKLLIEEAERLSKEKKVKKIAVISAIGTREYYRKRGFKDRSLYMIKEI